MPRSEATTKEQIKAYNRAKYDKIKAHIAQVKRDNPCPCGCDDVSMLEFHHVDPDTKTIDISKIRSWSRLLSELALCVVRCRPCHLAIHKLDKSGPFAGKAKAA